MKEIALAGGCFWGVEAYFKRVKGITATKSGYANGTTKDINYKELCTGKTGYVEACILTYDENILPLRMILNHLFRVIDPTSLNKQGGDIGTQYRTGIYYINQIDKNEIENYIEDQRGSYSKPIVVEVGPLDKFYNAEEVHQEYLEKNPSGYCHINFSVLKDDERQKPI
ncbi:MAG: peptide-methionine (S)-S-oxide reductase MsrA [Psychrilyobacter sp.]|nr:peptide-methionine (S)-S-oxide reductase MsrA [Psychrilyobacter sp.]